MATYADGSIALNTGTQDYTINFPEAFSALPDTVHLTVQNISADGTKLNITAIVTGLTTTQAQVRLDALPNTNNYTLNWMAAQGDSEFTATAAKLKKISEVTHEAVPNDADQFPYIRQSPLLRTVYATWAEIKSFLAQWAGAVPSAPTDAGALRQMIYNGTYLYVHTGSQWARIPAEVAASWATDVTINPVRRGLATLASGQQDHTISFSSAFGTGNDPVPRVLEMINTVDSPASVVAPVVLTAISKTQFTVRLNAATDTANFKLQYEFEQQP